MSTTRVPEPSAALADERALVEVAVREEGMTYPCYLDPDARWARQLRADRTPSFVVVDRAGSVSYRFTGLLEVGSPDFIALEHAIERALAAPRPTL